VEGRTLIPLEALVVIPTVVLLVAPVPIVTAEQHLALAVVLQLTTDRLLSDWLS